MFAGPCRVGGLLDFYWEHWCASVMVLQRIIQGLSGGLYVTFLLLCIAAVYHCVGFFVQALRQRNLPDV